MFRLIIFGVGIFLIVLGFKKIGTNSTPVVCSMEMVEKGDYSKYDYFKLSNGVVVGNYVYSQSRVSNNITQFVYPVFSQQFLTSLIEGSTPLDTIQAWLDNGKIKPKVYIKSKISNITEQDLKRLMDDTTEKVYEGTRLVSFADLDDAIKDKLGQLGITPDNTIFIEEGTTPGDEKGGGWLALIAGLVIVVLSIRSFIKRMKDD
jgi:hypothetical protein